MKRVSKLELRERIAADKGRSSNGVPAVDKKSAADRHLVDSTNSQSTSPFTSAKPRKAVNDARCPSVAEYRGTNAISGKKPSRNVADRPSELSLPVAEREAFPERTHRINSDITRHVEKAITTGHGNIFAKENCRTSQGWRSGKFY
jgi:hypothetical protein